MDRADIPLWSINEPGTYETRDGRATEVVGKFSEGYWVGGTDDDLMTWDDSGRQRVATDREPSGDIIGPWIEGGLPWDKILPAGERDPELLLRFSDAHKAGVKIECLCDYIHGDCWSVVDDPRWIGECSYRLHGSTADIERTPSAAQSAHPVDPCRRGILIDVESDQSPPPVKEQWVCDIVAEALELLAFVDESPTRSSQLSKVAAWLRNGMKD